MTEKATKQGNGVSPISGVAPPVHTQFGQPEGNPRHNGAWKKEDTPRFKLEQMMKLGDSELQEIIDDTATPTFERKLATSIQNGEWREIKEMIQEVYGKPKESIDLSNPDGSLTPVVRIIDERPKAK